MHRKNTIYSVNFLRLSLIPESWENGVQEAVSSTLATRTKQGPSRSAKKEPRNESFAVLFSYLCHKTDFHEIDSKGFFRSRIEYVLNNAKQLVFERAVSASMVHGFRFFFLKFYGTAIVYHAQYLFCGSLRETAISGYAPKLYLFQRGRRQHL